MKEYSDVSRIPVGGLGSSKNPHIKPWDTDWLPYGAWCICNDCKYLSQSTYSFDFYIDGDKIICEVCMMRSKIGKSNNIDE